MKYICLILLLLIGSCNENPISSDDEKLEWEKVPIFEGKSIYYVKEAGGKLLVSATDETLPEGTYGRGKLYISEDGLNWDIIKETARYSGPITYYKNKFYWSTDTIHVTTDFENWDSIVIRSSDGSPGGFSRTSLNDIVMYKDTLYGSEVSAGTFKILDGKEPERVYFDGHKYAGARKYFTIAEDEIIAIQNGGYTVYGDRPYRFRIPNGEFIEGDFDPDSSNSIASSTAFQYHDFQYYIASNFPEMVRVYENNQWVGITDTIPTTKHLDKYTSYVRNWALYIEFMKNDMYIGTRLGGVMKWDDIDEEWKIIRQGLPIRENVRGGVDDLYYPVHHFESFKGKLFAGFGFLDASSDPATLPVEKQGLYIYQQITD